MLRLTLAQMRTSAGRLAAAGIAIVLGTAFVAATLLASATMQSTTYRAVTAEYADADLVIEEYGGSIDAAALEEIRRLPGVRAADPVTSTGAQVTAGGASEWVVIGAVASDPSLSAAEYVTGAAPTTDGEIALPESAADRLSVTPGDTVDIERDVYVPGPDGQDGTWDMRVEAAVLTGTTTDPSGLTFASPSAFVTFSQLLAWQQAADDLEPAWGQVVVSVDTGTDVAQVQAALAAARPGADVLTVQEKAEALTAELTGNQQMFTVLLLGFAAVSLSVAALVIANTFQVLVAQRTRTLALLRCVGADKGQVRSTVLLEALVVGVASSIAGLVLGSVVVGAGLAVLGNADLDVPLDTTVHLTPAVVAVTLLTGTVVTLLAALVPARIATRVAPLAAMRPAEGDPVRGAGRLRVAAASVLLVGGVGALVLGIAVARGLGGMPPDTAILLGLALGVLGGLASLVGLLLGAVFVVPALIRLAGRVVARGVPARVAVVNAVRNPRRTGATASALLIGVSLVVMMSTGALGARVTLGEALDTQYPADLMVATPDGAALGVGQVNVVRETAGIESSTLLRTAPVTMSVPGGTMDVEAMAPTDQRELTEVFRDDDLLDGLTDDVVIVPEQVTTWLDISEGDAVSVVSGDRQLELTAVVSELGGTEPVLTAATLDRFDPQAQTNRLLARIADDADAAGVIADVQGGLTELSAATSDPVASVSGGAVERVAFQGVIDTLLAVVVGLLAVSVVIALVGVANTLSLSVLERRRESALLRAMGLTRGQLRGMLAVEGLLIAGAGALLGGAAGLLYGWAGSAVLLGELGQVPLVVPWRDLALVAAVAAIAGLLASVLPARSATRTPPVAALAAE